ncbi:hypothetical protein KSP40_PGU000442 [Platanthera guangdongensis]|uniref:Retrovirus-related Pol polyprotein from transposon TNT 1-94-like beta-barrel domain-containing protein n=1 Tax=Platanthera guangdongensis TaxID=2320717 RepID=A0ABR2MFU5_9ASPA
MMTTSIDALASINIQDDLIVGSSCGHHLTSYVTKFTTLKVYEGNDVIITADDTVHPVEKEEVVKVRVAMGPLTLKCVYHVPGIKKNLFSITNAVDAGYVPCRVQPKEVKFMKNLSRINGDVTHIVKDKSMGS